MRLEKAFPFENFLQRTWKNWGSKSMLSLSMCTQYLYLLSKSVKCSIVRVLCSMPAAVRDVPVRVPGKTFVFKGGDSGYRVFSFGQSKFILLVLSIKILQNETTLLKLAFLQLDLSNRLNLVFMT